MTKLLERAIAKAKELPESDQNDTAEMMLSIMSRYDEPVALDDETRAAIREGTQQARRGQFVSDRSMKAFFKKNGI